MDIEIEVASKLKEIVDTGKLTEIIDKQLTKTCTDIVQDLFRDYSEFGRDLKKKLQDKIGLTLDNLNIDGFTAVVNRIVEEKINGGLAEQYSKNIQQVITETCNVLEKKEWKLSELVVKCWMSSKDLFMDGETLELDVKEASYSSRWIMIGRKSKNSYSSSSTRWDIKILIDEKTKEVKGTWYEGKLTAPILGKMWDHRIETLLMQLWVNNCTLEIDVTDIDQVEYPDEYDQSYDN